MKKMVAVLNLSDGVSTIDSTGVSVAVETVESAHIPVFFVTQKEYEIALLKLDNIRQVLKNLRKQFGHYPAAELKDLLKSAGKLPHSVLEPVHSVCKECSTCQKFGRKQDKPCVSFPWWCQFNVVATIDLHQ